MAQHRSPKTPDPATAPGSGHITQHCARCDGQNLWFDAHAAWNADTGAWEVANVYDDATCLDCGRAGVTVETRRDGAVRDDAWIEPALAEEAPAGAQTAEAVAAREVAHAAAVRPARDHRAYIEGGA